MVRTKVFVGNLSFATKENELAKEFEAAGKVISANIITRGPRSLGYGFVEMDNETDAENAVKLLNKKEIDGRPINVEVAKPREEGGDDNGANTNGGRGGRGGRGGGRGGVRGGSRGGFRRGGDSGNQGGFRRFRRRDGSEDDGNNGGNDSNNNNNGDNNGSRGGRGRGRGGPRGSSRGGRGGSTRPRRDERPQEERTPSLTTLFVANLPFSLEDDGFGKILKDGNLAFKTAHVVKKRSGRSKGFGFVEFENEGDQQKALTALNNKNVEGRELVVKVALTENRSDEHESSENTTSNTTASTTTVTASIPEKKDEKSTTEVKQTTPKTEKK